MHWHYEVPCLKNIVARCWDSPSQSWGVDPAGYEDAWVPNVVPGQLWPEARWPWVSSGKGVAGYIVGLVD